MQESIWDAHERHAWHVTSKLLLKGPCLSIITSKGKSLGSSLTQSVASASAEAKKEAASMQPRLGHGWEFLPAILTEVMQGLINAEHMQ